MEIFAQDDRIGNVPNNGTREGNILINDSNPQGDEIEVTLLGTGGINYIIGEEFGGGAPLESGAIFFLDNEGNYRYDPNRAFNFLADGETATDSFEYTISDSEGNTSIAEVEVIITGESSSSNNSKEAGTDGNEVEAEPDGFFSGAVDVYGDMEIFAVTPTPTAEEQIIDLADAAEEIIDTAGEEVKGITETAGDALEEILETAGEEVEGILETAGEEGSIPLLQ